MLLLLLKFAVAGLVFSTGLITRRNDLFWIWQRPRLLGRSFVAMFLLVPLVAVVIVTVFDLPMGTKAALLFLSISSSAPLLPKKLIKLGGDPDYVFSLVVATSLLATLTVPLSLLFLARLLPVEISVGPIQIAVIILKTFLLPLAAGILFRRLNPQWAQKLGDPLMRIAGAALVIGALVVVIGSWRLLRDIGIPTYLAFGGFTFSALTIGHLLGGPDHRTSLAVACTTRHIGLALLIAAHVRGPKTFSLVAAYLVASAVVSIPYLQWTKRRLKFPQ